MATENHTSAPAAGADVADLDTARSILRLWLLGLSEDNFDASALQVAARSIAEALSETEDERADRGLQVLYAGSLMSVAEAALWQHGAEDQQRPDVDDLRRVGQHALDLLEAAMAEPAEARHG